MGPFSDSHGFGPGLFDILFWIGIFIVGWLFNKGREHARGKRPEEAPPSVQPAQAEPEPTDISNSPSPINDRATCATCGEKLSRRRGENDVSPPWWIRRFRVDHEGHDIRTDVDFGSSSPAAK